MAIAERDALAAQVAALREALEKMVELLNDPGVGDIDQWKRECKIWTAKSRAALSAPSAAAAELLERVSQEGYHQEAEVQAWLECVPTLDVNELAAAHDEQVRAEEREACASVADDHACEYRGGYEHTDDCRSNIAAAIRARGKP